MDTSPSTGASGARAAVGRVRKVWDDTRRTLEAVLRTTPHDVSTAEGRSKERYRRAALSTVTSAIAQGLGIFTGLASIRITIGYLGKEQYGLWMAVSALLTWAALADFGLGRGVQNHLSEAYGLEDRDAAARYVSTGFVVLSVIALLFTVVMLPLLFVIPWVRVLNVQDPTLTSKTRVVVAAVAAVFICNFPLSLVPTIYRAHQRGYVANLFAIVGNVLSLVALLVIVGLRLPMPWLIMTAGGTGVFMTLVNFAWILREMPWLRPRWSLATRATLRSLAGVSIPMLLYQLGGLVINETQTILIAHRIGLAGVTDYSILMRVYVLPAMLIGMIDGPLIPAFREAYVRGDREWLRSAFWRLTKIKMLIAAGAAVAYLLLGNFAVKLLSGRAVSFDWRVWAACGFLQFVAIWNVSFNDLLIAINRLWVLVIGILFNGLVTLSLTWWFSKPLGILGVVLATPIYSLLVTAWLFPWFSRDVVGAPSTQRATS